MKVPAPVVVTEATQVFSLGVKRIIEVALTRVHVTVAVTVTPLPDKLGILTVPHAEELAAAVPADASSRPADFVRILAEAPLWI